MMMHAVRLSSKDQKPNKEMKVAMHLVRSTKVGVCRLLRVLCIKFCMRATRNDRDVKRLLDSECNTSCYV